MPSLLAIIGTCLTATVAASPADRYDDRAADRDAAPWWANATTPDASPARPIGDAASKATAPATARSQVAGVAEVASDSPLAGRADAKEGIASFADGSPAESGVQMPAKSPTASGKAATAILRRETDTPPAYLPSQSESRRAGTGPLLESSNVLRPPPAPTVVATAATSPAPAVSTAP
jgi:hypothetical protein